MRLHRIALRNFRGVAECDVALAESGVTIVEGDNETGKSSLAEGVDLILEYLDSSKAGQVKQVQPVDADVGPEVEIEMSAGEYRFTFAKRWVRRPQTTLTVHAPAPEQVTGREAHDRVSEILAENADMALWKALRLEQGVDLAQAGLSESRSLMRALDAASGSSSTGDEAADLIQRVDEEFERYHTPKGQPNKHLRSMRDEAAAARRRVVELTDEIAGLETDIDRHARIERRLLEALPRRQEQEKLVKELEESERQIGELQGEADRLGDRLKVAQLETEEARGAVAARSQLAKTTLEQDDACQKQATELAAANTAIGEAERERGALREARNAAREALAKAEDAAELAAQDLGHHQSRMWRDTLLTRHEAVVEALEKRQEADAFLDVCRTDDDLLSRIEEAETSVVEARAVLAANRTEVRLESLADQTIVVDGEEREVAAGDVTEEPVSGTLAITLPDRLRLEVSAGADTQELADRVAHAERGRERLLRQADVGDVASARAQLKTRDSMTQARDVADQTLETNLRDLTPDEMVAKLARLDADTAAYVTERPDEPPLPPDLEAAEDRVRSAGESVEAARQDAKAADDALEQASADRVTAEKEVAAGQALLDQAVDERDALLERLAEDRDAVPDETLDASLAARTSVLHTARSNLEKAQAALEERDPETVSASLANARSALDRLDGEEKRDAAERQRLEGRLETVGEKGLFDRLAEATTEAESIDRELDALERRASAASALHEVLHRHREAARRRYRAPLEDKIEQLGRIVFGEDLSVELDADLRIVRRTLAGVTVPYESLSTGAREQLCVLERLASASLVSSEGGAPVIFDDALGYSDPDRLRRIGAVLGIAGRDCQVLLLTCTPDRYSHVGDATVVRLAQE